MSSRLSDKEIDRITLEFMAQRIARLDAKVADLERDHEDTKSRLIQAGTENASLRLEIDTLKRQPRVVVNAPLKELCSKPAKPCQDA